MCGCHRCGESTDELGHATPDMCINALKGELRAAREGREMVRESLTGERDRLREVLDDARLVLLDVARTRCSDAWGVVVMRAQVWLDDTNPSEPDRGTNQTEGPA